MTPQPGTPAVADLEGQPMTEAGRRLLAHFTGDFEGPHERIMRAARDMTALLVPRIEAEAARRATEENVALREALRKLPWAVYHTPTGAYRLHGAVELFEVLALLATSTPSEESEAGT